MILDFEREIDFRLYVNKYHRNNEWLENIIKEDMKLMNGNKNVPYYKYKKEKLEKKFKGAKDTLVLLIGAMKEYTNTNSIYLKRSIL